MPLGQRWLTWIKQDRRWNWISLNRKSFGCLSLQVQRLLVSALILFGMRRVAAKSFVIGLEDACASSFPFPEEKESDTSTPGHFIKSTDLHKRHSLGPFSICPCWPVYLCSFPLSPFPFFPCPFCLLVRCTHRPLTLSLSLSFRPFFSILTWTDFVMAQSGQLDSIRSTYFLLLLFKSTTQWESGHFLVAFQSQLK